MAFGIFAKAPSQTQTSFSATVVGKERTSEEKGYGV